jgi:hypothetical protein
LDPIDVRFYEPHLKANARQYYQKCYLLFGALTHLNPLYKETYAKTISISHFFFPHSFLFIDEIALYFVLVNRKSAQKRGRTWFHYFLRLRGLVYFQQVFFHR